MNFPQGFHEMPSLNNLHLVLTLVRESVKNILRGGESLIFKGGYRPNFGGTKPLLLYLGGVESNSGILSGVKAFS